ncbi:MAG: N-acyl homoserine lactonase family protein [Nitrospirae bacterium]|nr:N-acyl homoserine lactonase family protein [Nitrospirota bacterium]
MGIYKIHPLVVGTKVFDKSYMTYQFGQGETYTIPIYAWYIEGNGRKILVDTGELSPARFEAREKAIGGKIYSSLQDALSRWDLSPLDIDTIVHTHLHNDHCENDDKCTNATIYVHETEMRTIHDSHPLDYRYMEDYILEPESNGQIKTISGDTEVLPDIHMIHTPAHTSGGCSVSVQTGSGKAVITGFCCIMENFTPPPQIRGMGMDVIIPGTHVNVYEAYDIMLKTKSMADILIPLHEPRFARADTIP